jgi:hypothetical protein
MSRHTLNLNTAMSGPSATTTHDRDNPNLPTTALIPSRTRDHRRVPAQTEAMLERAAIRMNDERRQRLEEENNNLLNYWPTNFQQLFDMHGTKDDAHSSEPEPEAEREAERKAQFEARWEARWKALEAAEEAAVEAAVEAERKAPLAKLEAEPEPEAELKPELEQEQEPELVPRLKRKASPKMEDSPGTDARPRKKHRRMYRDCPICHEKMIKAEITVVRPCDHQFCFHCIEAWLYPLNKTCPMCRTPVTRIRNKDGKVEIAEIHEGYMMENPDNNLDDDDFDNDSDDSYVDYFGSDEATERFLAGSFRNPPARRVPIPMHTAFMNRLRSFLPRFMVSQGQ